MEISARSIVRTGGTATTLTVAGVGSGTYYVGIRGKNSCGPTGHSNEIIVGVR